MPDESKFREKEQDHSSVNGDRKSDPPSDDKNDPPDSDNGNTREDQIFDEVDEETAKKMSF